MITSPEDDKKTEDYQRTVTPPPEYKSDCSSLKTPTKPHLPKETYNDRKMEANTSSPIQNQSPENKLIISFQSNISINAPHTNIYV